MQIIKKKVVFYTMIMLLIGVTNHLVYAQSSLYWTETVGESIHKSNLEGTLEEGVRMAQHNHTVSRITADYASGKIYWTGTFTLNNIMRGTIRSANLDGTNEIVLHDSANGIVRFPGDITVDSVGGKIYWTELGLPSPGVYRSDLDGSFPERLINNFALRSNYGSGPGQNLEHAQATALALDLIDKKMCWTDDFGKYIHCSDLDGTNMTRVASSLPGAAGIDIDPMDGTIYFVTGNGKSVMRVNQNGTGLQEIVSGNLGTDLDQAMDIATDSQSLYFTDLQAGYIYRSYMDGTGVIQLSTRQYERSDKPGRWKSLEPRGIALALDMGSGSGSTPTPTPTPTPTATATATATATPTPTATATATASVPGIPTVEYRADKGKWNIFVAASTTGVPTTYTVVVFDPANSLNSLNFLSGHPTNSAASLSIKGMTLASQLGGDPSVENGSYMAITVTADGVQSTPVSIRMR